MLLVAEMPITQMRSEWAQRTTNPAADARGKGVIKVVIDDEFLSRKMKRDSKLLTVGAVPAIAFVTYQPPLMTCV